MKQKIRLSKEAALVLEELAAFVEERNTREAGKRFKHRFLSKIKSQLDLFSEHKICKYPEFAERNLRCFFIHNWVIAYKKDQSTLIVYTIVLGKLLDY